MLLGNYYANPLKDHAKALAAFRQGLAVVTPADQPSLIGQIPADYQRELGLLQVAAPAAQTSSSSK